MSPKPLVTVTISGPQGSGKTRLETLLLDALLNAGASGFASYLSMSGEITEKCSHFGADIAITTKDCA